MRESKSVPWTLFKPPETLEPEFCTVKGYLIAKQVKVLFISKPRRRLIEMEDYFPEISNQCRALYVVENVTKAINVTLVENVTKAINVTKAKKCHEI